MGKPPGLGGGKGGLRALRRLWLNLQSAYELRRSRCERPKGNSPSECDPTRISRLRLQLASRSCSPSCCSSNTCVLRRTQIDPFVERERGQQGRAPINQLHNWTWGWPAPTLLHTTCHHAS